MSTPANSQQLAAGAAHRQAPLVRCRVINSTGVIELDRPRALHSLNHEMVLDIAEVLEKWAQDSCVHRVLIRSTGDRAFCAGGDVRQVRDEGCRGNYLAGDRFFSDEYVMNDDLAQFPKPIVSLLDGVVMGGGLGLSCHGSHRVVTERTLAAMPEMAIGFIPDVGMSYFMQRMQGPDFGPSYALGVFLATTGYRLSAADMLWCGMATDFVPAAQLGEFSDILIAESLDEALERCGETPTEPSELARWADAIEATFDFESFAEIAQAVAAYPDQQFQELVATHFAVASPTSLVAAVELMAANRQVTTLRHGLDNELALGNLLRRGHDFEEGVRAVLVDKDRNPCFEPAEYQQVRVGDLRAVLHRA